MKCPHCSKEIQTEAKPRHSRTYAPSSTGRKLVELVGRFERILRVDATKALGLSPEACRCLARRLRSHNLLRAHAAPGGGVYLELSVAGATLIGVEPPKRCGHAGLFCRLAVASYCVENTKRLLEEADLHALLEKLEAHGFEKLLIPGLPRRRFFVDDEKRLSFAFVDLGGVETTGAALLKRLVLRAKKFAGKSEGWRRLVSEGRLSFTVLSPFARADLPVAARHAGLRLPISLHRIDLLRNAIGLGENTSQLGGGEVQSV